MLTHKEYLDDSPSIFFKWKNEENYPVIYVTENVSTLFDATAADFYHGDIHYHELVHPEDVDTARKELDDAIATDLTEFRHTPYRIKSYDGWKWVDDVTKIVKKDGQVIELYGYISDITEILHLKNKLTIIKQSQLQIFQALNSKYLISKSDLKGNIIYANAKLCEESGYTYHELRGQPHSIFRHPDTPKETFEAMWKTIQNKKIWNGTTINSKKNGESMYMDSTIVPKINSAGDIVEYLAIRHDVSDLFIERERHEKSLKTSQTTNIPNRVALLEYIQNEPFATTALIDINSFHELNDFIGYDAGDHILNNLVNYIKNSISPSCRLFHIQADQFIIVTDHPLEQIKTCMYRFQDELHQATFKYGDHSISIRVTIAASEEKKDFNLRSLDMAMEFAKKNRIPFTVFSSSIDQSERYKENQIWLHRVKEAFDDNRIIPYYQPLLSTVSGEIERYEALARMIETDGSIVSPGLFLPIIYQSNQTNQLSKVIIKQVMDDFRNSHKSVSINITVTDMLDQDFIEFIMLQLKDFPNPKRLIFEILESEEINDFKGVSQFIQTIKTYGCQIAIDDFGSGYANFENLLRLKADIIKIDGSLIKDIHKTDNSYDIVEAITFFAKKKGIQIVAERVEDEYIFVMVESLGIDYAQGYYIGKPSPYCTATALEFSNSGTKIA